MDPGLITDAQESFHDQTRTFANQNLPIHKKKIHILGDFLGKRQLDRPPTFTTGTSPRQWAHLVLKASPTPEPWVKNSALAAQGYLNIRPLVFNTVIMANV